VVEVTGAIAYLVESQDDVVQGEAEQSAQPAAAAAPVSTAAPAAGKPALAPTAAPTTRPQGSKASPLARKLAAQQGVDLDRVSGSGPGGVVTSTDVQRAPAPFEVAVPGDGRPMKSMEKAISRAMASSISMPTFRVSSHIRLESLMGAAR